MTIAFHTVIIAGSRDVDDASLIPKAVAASGWAFWQVAVGKARGVDHLAELWARFQGYGIREFPADWGRYGVRAGHLRNAEMAQHADALIAIWNGRSPGTKNMIEQMHKRGKPTFIYRVAA